MSSIIFSAPRTIDSVTKIPRLGWQDRINLSRTDAGSYAGIRAGGAKGSREKGWYIERDGSVLLEPLDPFLPQFARRSIVPNVVDLIPETSWCSSLANMLSTRSWKLLRDVVIARVGRCDDCGSPGTTECTDRWTYEEDLPVTKIT